MRRVCVGLAVATAAFGQQSALDPAGQGAASIHRVILFFTGLLGLIFVIVVVMTIIPLMRGHRGIDQEPIERTHAPSPSTEQRLGRVVGFATIVTILILFGLVIVSVSTSKATSPTFDRRDAIAIEVIGNQWWWYVRYANTDPSRIVVTANELHIPVGRPVMIRGTSNDVIHSFWVPNLQGKRDLIPSRVTMEWLQADRAGR